MIGLYAIAEFNVSNTLFEKLLNCSNCQPLKTSQQAGNKQKYNQLVVTTSQDICRRVATTYVFHV
jgi:hypothetical protein